MVDVRNAYSVLVGEPEGKRPLGRTKHRCRDNIKMGRREIVWKGVEWMLLALHRDQWRVLVNT
jgi:hypothetical protein